MSFVTTHLITLSYCGAKQDIIPIYELVAPLYSLRSFTRGFIPFHPGLSVSYPDGVKITTRPFISMFLISDSLFNIGYSVFSIDYF
ncbi:MAG: hypothetical protein A2W90_16550 [Bacteroidetes bacterium GWF2_42_66]|nr:MAG: hypothetical protein A2W92_04065 [Bacteroidetes bacterium GWA2_42_15]OFX96304.1 MAG: hypothetical protein A2W89_05480 [Bacteroidetes bacterium GWE2_42_39]OFY46343.1 MAG: hypothetical protein A2W90_16550 [Bacteroidetes bacterium GWF2_42_66]HAZ03465.1 hypothetical protein [Marinilabiliales bacterium]HBL78271.1 hypothetical protein [Prolixibacteraceae bacterium]